MRNTSIFDELEKSAEEMLSKAEEKEKLDLDPDDIAEDDSQEPEEAENEDEDEDEGEGAETEEEAAVRKSLEDELSKGGGVSEIDAAIVEILSKSLADAQEFQENSSGALAKSLLSQNAILKVHQLSLDKTNRGVAKLKKSFDGLMERLDAIDEKLDSFGSQPAHMRKSVGTSAEIVDRNFGRSLNGSAQGNTGLSKGQIVEILTDEMLAGNTAVRPEDICRIEAGGTIGEPLRRLAEAKSAR